MDLHNIERDLDATHYNFEATFQQLIDEWHIENVFSEKELLERIDDYISEHKQEILDFLWETWKILVPMNSAEIFADIVIEKLGIDSSQIRVSSQIHQNLNRSNSQTEW